MPHVVQRTWTSADGLSLVADDYAGAEGPAKTPVICLHGLTRNARDFDVLAPHIAAGGRRVIAPDIRGRGRSAYDPNPVNYNPLVYAGDVIALMTQAGVARAIFIGTSMGGLITMTLSALRPDMVAGAVLNDVGPAIGPEGLARIGGYVGVSAEVNSWQEAADYARSLNGDALPGLSDADWMTFGRRLFREDPHGRFTLDYDPAISQAFQASPAGAPAAPAPDLWPIFAALAFNRPLLVVRGANSDILEAATATKMVATAPHITFAEIPNVGHAPTLEEPEAVAAIDALLAAAS
jgi:pimeloyl-ACP methyl ester carboxylesterase